MDSYQLVQIYRCYRKEMGAWRPEMEGWSNKDNCFSVGSIQTMLEKDNAKDRYPAVFRWQLFAQSISSKWRRDKKVLLGLDLNPKNPMGCPPGTIRQKTFFNGQLLNVILPIFKETVGPGNKITVNDPTQLEFLRKLIDGKATTDDIPHKSFKSCSKQPRKIQVNIPDFDHEEVVVTSKRDSEDEDDIEQDINDEGNEKSDNEDNVSVSFLRYKGGF